MAWSDRHWALAVMKRGLESVRGSFAEVGKENQFETLKPWLVGDAAGPHIILNASLNTDGAPC